jgi:ubiquitin-like protein Pup
MAQRIQKQKRASAREEVQEEPVKKASTSERNEETEHLLDEIDELLEENAEDFVKQYVQKGGQ